MTEAQEQELAHRICETLRGLCPAFSYAGGGPVLWHCCDCLMGGPCICVWHMTDACEAGIWPQLSFVADAGGRAKKDKEAMIAKVKLVMSGA